ncbi:hypothetical protein CR513_08876, partial [Mucuna pruriens]
ILNVVVNNGGEKSKPKNLLEKERKRKVQLDLKVKNIITIKLGINEFFRVFYMFFSKRNVRYYKSLMKFNVIVIAKSNNLSTMLLAIFFGKIHKHELQLSRLRENEENNKKKNKYCTCF